jgi:hypothetical protein
LLGALDGVKEGMLDGVSDGL